MRVRADEQARVIVALALCDDRALVPGFADRLTERHLEDTMVNRVWLPLIRAAATLRFDPSGSIQTLRSATPFEGAAESWPIYLRGLALLRIGKAVEARAEFQKIIEHRGRTFWVPFYPLAHLGVARVATDRAYREFFSIWKDADADLPVIIEARKEYDRLRSAVTR